MAPPPSLPPSSACCCPSSSERGDSEGGRGGGGGRGGAQGAAHVGGVLKAALQRELGSLPGVKDIRGQGLMLGIELTRPCGVLVGRAADAGLLMSVTADSVIRLVPPLILSEAEALQIVAILVPLVRQFLAEAVSTP